MNKKKQKVKINKNLVLVLSGALVLSVGICLGMIGISAVKADVPFWDKVAQVTGIELADRVPVPEAPSENIIVGAFPGPDIYEAIRFHDGYTGAPLNVPLKFPGATTTAMTDLVLGVHVFNEDVFLSNWGWGITEPNNDSGCKDFRIGTTTLTSGSRFEPGVHSLTNTTTGTIIDTTEMATSTDDVVFDVRGYGEILFGGTGVEGNTVTSTFGTFFEDLVSANSGNRRATTTPFFISAGTVLVASCGDDGGATSSDALITGSALDFRGFFYANDLFYQK